MPTGKAGSTWHATALDRTGHARLLLATHPHDITGVDDWNRMIDVNLRGVLHGIAAVLPSMRERRSGHIINVASTAAHRVDPTGVVYSATKFAVRAVSDGLAQERSGWWFR